VREGDLLEGEYLPMSTHVTDRHVQEARPPSRFVAAINNPHLIAAVLLCVIGLAIGAVLALRFPDFAAIMAQSNQF
jgi:hypothetical protein